MIKSENSKLNENLRYGAYNELSGWVLSGKNRNYTID